MRFLLLDGHPDNLTDADGEETQLRLFPEEVEEDKRDSGVLSSLLY